MSVKLQGSCQGSTDPKAFKAFCALPLEALRDLSLQVFATDDHLVIVTDYATAGSLSSHIEAEGAMPEAKAKDFFKQLADGMTYCHRSDQPAEAKDSCQIIQYRPKTPLSILIATAA